MIEKKTNMASELVDLEEVVKKWSEQLFEMTKSKEQSKIPKEQLQYNVNWKRVKFLHSEPQFVDQEKPPTPKSLVLFKTFFSNGTEQQQEYSFRTQRTTRSACEVMVERAYTVGYELNVALKTPCEVFEANAGFHQELQLTNAQGETIEEEMSWEVDSMIKVPAKHKTTAELVVSEDQFSGKFVMDSEISGSILVTVTNIKDNNSFVKSIEGNIVEIMRAMRDKEPGLKMFTLDKKKASFQTKGKCNFRYAIEQHVHLSNEPI